MAFVNNKMLLELFLDLLYFICSVSCITCYNGCLPSNGSCLDCEPGYFPYGSICRIKNTVCLGFLDLFSDYDCQDGLGNPACYALATTYGYSCFPSSHSTSCIECKTFCELCSFSECMQGYIYRQSGITEHMILNCLNNSVSCAFTCLECEENCLKGHYWNVNAKIVNACHACSYSCAERSCNGRNGHCSKGCVDNRFWGARCEKPCQEHCLFCEQNTGNCLDCINKTKFGKRCEQNCSDNCQNAASYSKNGTCSLGCIEGFYGNFCQLNCSLMDTKCSTCITKHEVFVGCKKCMTGYYPLFNTSVGITTCQECRKNCLNRNCSSVSGNCLEGCVGRSFWGKQCEKECARDCIECGQESGTCLNCKNKLYGSLCQYECPAFCKRTTCDIENGTCTLGCIVGYFGDTCVKTCDSIDPGCFDCNSDNTGLYDGCNKCRKGYYLLTNETGLTKQCRSCSFSCIDQSCDVTAGYCTIGCVNRTWGSFCELNCSEKCIQCNQNGGQCLLCKESWYGKICDLECPSMCFKQKCDLLNGSCIMACKTGYRGDMCDLMCSSGCWNNACDQWTGRCLHGCLPGRSGLLCEEPKAELDSHYFLTVTAISATVFVCLGGIFVGFFAYIRKRWRKRTRTCNTKDAPTDTIYDDICGDLYDEPKFLSKQIVHKKVDLHQQSTRDSDESLPDHEASTCLYLTPVYDDEYIKNLTSENSMTNLKSAYDV